MAMVGDQVRAFPKRIVPNAISLVIGGAIIMVMPGGYVLLGSGIVLLGSLILPLQNRLLYVQLVDDGLVVSHQWTKEPIPRADIAGLERGRGRNRTSLRLTYGKLVPVEVASFASASRRKEIEETLWSWVAQGPTAEDGNRPPAEVGQSGG